MSRRNVLLHTYLLDLMLPGGSIDALLDTTDSIWYCLDRYGREQGMESVQLLSLSPANNITGRVSRRQGNTEWVFIPNRPCPKAWEIVSILPRTALLQIHNISAGNLLTAILGKLAGAKVIIAFLNDYAFDQYNAPFWMLRFVLNRIPDAVLAATEVNKEKLARTFRCSFFVLHYGIDTEHFRPSAATEAHDNLRVVYVGRITPDKNVDDIVQGVGLCRQKRKMHIRFVGHQYDASDAYVESLKRSLVDKEIFHEFAGYISHSALPALLNQADVMVNMRKQEGFGKVFIEAMGCGKPVIGRKGSAGPEEIIRPGENGFLVDSPEELACMLDMLAENREVLARMGHTAREDAERLYSYETIYREFASRYSALLRS